MRGPPFPTLLGLDHLIVVLARNEVRITILPGPRQPVNFLVSDGGDNGLRSGNGSRPVILWPTAPPGAGVTALT